MLPYFFYFAINILKNLHRGAVLTHERVAAAPQLLCVLILLDQRGLLAWAGSPQRAPCPCHLPAVLPDTATVQHQQRNWVGMRVPGTAVTAWSVPLNHNRLPAAPRSAVGAFCWNHWNQFQLLVRLCQICPVHQEAVPRGDTVRGKPHSSGKWQVKGEVRLGVHK